MACRSARHSSAEKCPGRRKSTAGLEVSSSRCDWNRTCLRAGSARVRVWVGSVAVEGAADASEEELVEKERASEEDDARAAIVRGRGGGDAVGGTRVGWPSVGWACGRVL